MKEEIENSKIIRTIVKRIEFDFKDDISIFACYGSAIAGDYYIIPKTERGYSLKKSFLLNSLGYDLVMLSWFEVENISNCVTPSTSVLASSEVMFYSKEEDLNKLRNYKDNIYYILNDHDKNHILCIDKLAILNDQYKDLKNIESPTWDVKIIDFFENYLITLSTLNKTYLKNGFQNFRQETHDFKLLPENLNYRISETLKCNDRKTAVSQTESLYYDLNNLVTGADFTY